MTAAFLASLPMSDTLWLTTAELCSHLAISRSTLFAIRRSGLLKDGRHLVAKNPTSSRSHLLWHRQRCELALGRISA
jgi:hypothetical protein